MVTATDDINARLAAVEADIRNIYTQLAELNANLRQFRAESQAEIRAMRAENQAEIQAMRAENQAEVQAMRVENQAEVQAMRAENQALHQEARSEHQADIRQLHARIDRVFWAIIGFGSAVFLTMLGLLLTLILKL